MKYDLVIFDFDGVILDSGLDGFEWLEKVRMKKASEMGYDFSRKDSRMIVKTNSYSELKEFMSSKNMPEKDLIELEKKVQDAKINLIQHGAIRLFPRTKQIINEMQVTKALATNSPSKSAEFALDYFDLKSEFKSIEMYSIGNPRIYMDRKKPSPDMLENAIEQTGSQNPLMVGDSTADIEAAKNAGIDSVLVKTYSDGLDINPDYEVRDLTEFQTVLSDELS